MKLHNSHHQSFIHSFIPAIFIAPLQVLYYFDYSTDTVSEFHAEAHRQLQVKDKQGPYVAARAGVDPTTPRLKVIVSTKEPPLPTFHVQSSSDLKMTECCSSLPWLSNDIDRHVSRPQIE